MKIRVWLASIIVTALLTVAGWFACIILDVRADQAVMKNDLASVKQSLSILENRGGNVATR